jgi:hypothetical protein
VEVLISPKKKGDGERREDQNSKGEHGVEI